MKRRSYSKEFKRQAVLLVLNEGNPPQTIAKQLDIHVNSLYRWITEYETYGEVQAKMVKTNLNRTAIEIAKQAQTIVAPMIDALGLDFAIDENQKIYIIEINAFPGTRPFEANVERYAIPYALFLAKNSKKVR